MPNDTKGRVVPLRARDMQTDRSSEDADWTEAATAPSQPKSATARGFRLLWAAMGLAVILLLILMYHRSTSLEFQNAPRVMAQKLETLTALRINFLKSIEAEKLAVFRRWAPSTMHDG